MNVVSEHSIVSSDLPEINIPKSRPAAVQLIMKANGGEKPIWHTEQGLSGDDDGYLPATLSEIRSPALYMRNLLMCRSLGNREACFWFSAHGKAPTYGMTVFYEDWTPRAPPLVCPPTPARRCSRDELPEIVPAQQQRLSLPLPCGSNRYGVVWSMNAPTRLSLPIRPEGIEAAST